MKVSKNIVILLTLGKSLGCPLIFNLNKTPLGETRCLSNPYFLLTGCLGIQFFPLSQHSQFSYLWLPTPHCAALVWLTGHHAMPVVTKCFPPNPYLGKGRISPYPSLCSTCVTYRTPCHAIGHQVLPTQPLPREAEDFPRGDKHFKHVPPLTYLIYFSPKGYTQ